MRVIDVVMFVYEESNLFIDSVVILVKNVYLTVLVNI